MSTLLEAPQESRPKSSSIGQQDPAEVLQLVEEFGSLLWTKSSALASWVFDYTKHTLAELDQVYVRRPATTSNPSHPMTKPKADSFDSEDSTCSITSPSDTDEEVGNDSCDGFQSEHLGDSLQYWRDIILGVNDGT